MANVEFSLLNENGEPVKIGWDENGYFKPNSDGSESFLVSEDGFAKIMYLPMGKYTLVEHTPAGFVGVAPMEIEITSEHAYKTPYELEIANVPTAMTIEKTDKLTGTGMPDVEFSLINETGEPVKVSWNVNEYFVPDAEGSESFLVNDEGFAKIMYLPLGKYTLVEKVPGGYVPIDPIEIEIANEHTYEMPFAVSVENVPTALNLYKVKSEDGAPLAGAGFTFKVANAGGEGFETLTFARLDDGRYMVDDAGAITEIMVDDAGKISVVGLPLGDVHIEETTVPDGYFPIAPQKVTVTAENTIDVPLELTVKNDVFVKLGLDTDKYNVLIAIGFCILCAGVVVWRFVRAKKKNK